MEDIAELKSFLAVAKQEKVKDILTEAIATLEKSVPVPADKPAIVEAAPIGVSAPVSATTTSKPLMFSPIASWGWEQNKEFVEVLILSGIEGVGSLPKEAITCHFEPTAFDLKIMGLRGTNYRLRVTNLDKDIIPEKSLVEVKKNRIILRLKKKGEWDHWIDLVAKKLRKAEESKTKSDDPSASIMDMMKDMYETGDASTRKIIAEAWSKSRDQQKSGSGKAGFGDMGDLDI